MLGIVIHAYKGKGGRLEDQAFKASYILRACVKKQAQKRKGNGVGSRQAVTMLTRSCLMCFKVQKNQQ